MAQPTATSNQGRSRSVNSSASTRSSSTTSNYRERLQALVENQREGQRILQSLGGRISGTSLTPDQVREASVDDLQRHPSLWEAYIRGWQACIASMPMPPTPRLPYNTGPRFIRPAGQPQNTWSTPRPIRPAGLQRPQWRQPNVPTRSSGPKAPTLSVTQISKSATPVGQPASTATDGETSRRTTPSAKRKSMARLAEHRQKKRQEMRRRLQESQANTSQQFRLEKPVGLDSNPAPLEKSWNPVHRPVPAPRTIIPAVAEVPMEVEDQGAEQGKEEDTLEEEISNFLDQEQKLNSLGLSLG